MANSHEKIISIVTICNDSEISKELIDFIEKKGYKYSYKETKDEIPRLVVLLKK